MEQVEGPSYKTINIEPDERHLILLVLDEAVKAGRNYEFNYTRINNLNHISLQKTAYIEKTIEKKKLLFDKLDQRSYTYERIKNTAKIALEHLKHSSVYEYNSAELIIKFIQLEDEFGDRKLKSTGVRFIEEAPIKEVKEKKILKNTPQEEIELIEEIIPNSFNGKKLISHKEKLNELKELNFENTESNEEEE